MFTFNFKLEKMVKFGDNGRVYPMADVFNLFYGDTVLRRLQNNQGWCGEGHASNRRIPSINAYKVDGVMNPRVLRLGVRFTF